MKIRIKIDYDVECSGVTDNVEAQVGLVFSGLIEKHEATLAQSMEAAFPGVNVIMEQINGGE